MLRAICGWQTNLPVFFECHIEVKSNRFLGSDWDVRTMPAFWPLIPRRAAYGLVFFSAALPISLTGRSAPHIQQPMGWARVGWDVFDSTPTVRFGPPLRADSVV